MDFARRFPCQFFQAFLLVGLGFRQIQLKNGNRGIRVPIGEGVHPRAADHILHAPVGFREILQRLLRKSQSRQRHRSEAAIQRLKEPDVLKTISGLCGKR